MPTWDQTQLWKLLTLKTRDNDAARALLVSKLPDAEDLLRAGGTAPSDFTLHDDGHAYRVAERMPEIVPEDVQGHLSRWEIGLLLLAAYLHDIGMTPRAGLVRAVHDYIFAGATHALSLDESHSLQLWLDEFHATVELPLNRDGGTIDALGRARLLTTHYCRSRHNVWSEEWIRGSFEDVAPAYYPSLVGDLVLLCKSHHQGYTDLTSPAFDPRPVGPLGELIHLRYLACVLRIADILDLDPERTPDVVLRHRDVSAGSLLYWHKDHDASVVIRQRRVTISARPTRAVIQRALEDTAEALDVELALCRRLDENTHFDRAVALPEGLPHRWDLASSTRRDIQARPGTYTYIQGAFRTDTHRVLELLGGTALYLTPLACVRELLQNAFDAVREQLAWEELSAAIADDTAAGKDLALRARLHSVTLTLQSGPAGLRLVCTDTGVGMTRGIIEDVLLVTGAGRHRETVELERLCADRRIPLERTGRFGIGALSYFMLARRVTIITRRSAESRSAEASGWRFEAEGLGGFGELRAEAAPSRGTEVRLHLLPSMTLEDAPEFYAALRKYVVELVRHVPCVFRLTTSLTDGQALELQPGWTSPPGDLLVPGMNEKDQSGFGDGPDDLLPKAGRERAAAVALKSRELVELGRGAMSVREKTGTLPAGLGRYRLRLATFDVGGEPTLGYLRTQRPRHGGLQLDADQSPEVLVPRLPTRCSSLGMAVETFGSRVPDAAFGAVELDFTSDDAGVIDVSRSAFELSAEGTAAARYAVAELDKLAQELADEFAASRFGALNTRLACGRAGGASEFEWAVLPAEDEPAACPAWRPVRFPATTDSGHDTLESIYRGLVRLVMNNETVDFLAPLSDRVTRYGSRIEAFDGVPPDRFVVSEFVMPDAAGEAAFGRGYNVIMPIWDHPPEAAGTRLQRQMTKLPPGWDAVAAVQRSRSKMNFNESHPLVKLLTEDAWDWADKRQLGFASESAWNREIRAEIAADVHKAAAWCLTLAGGWAGSSRDRVWRAVVDRDPKLIDRLWDGIGLESDAPVIVLDSDGDGIMFSRDRWTMFRWERWTEELGRWLPEVSAEWRFKWERTAAR